MKKMKKLLKRVRGEDCLTATMTFKMNDEKKTKYTTFAVANGLSMGKIMREALDRLMIDIIEELGEDDEV